METRQKNNRIEIKNPKVLCDNRAQLEQLKRFGVDEIVHEKITGIAKEKPKLEGLLERLEDGDTLVATRMDRLGRSTIQLPVVLRVVTQ